MLKKLFKIVLWSVATVAVLAVARPGRGVARADQRSAGGGRAARLPAAGGHARVRGRRHADRRVLRRAALPDSDRPGPQSRQARLSRRRGRRVLPASRRQPDRASCAPCSPTCERGEIVQGASTITQQVVKQLLLSPERTFERKAKELILALELESKLSKDEILYLYLNHIYFGAGTYGISAAAQTLFGKPVGELSLAQAALLAGLPQAPSRYDPMRRPAGRHRAAALRPRSHGRRSASSRRRNARRRAPSRCASRTSRRRPTPRRPGTSSTCDACSRSSTDLSSPISVCTCRRRSTCACRATPRRRCATGCAPSSGGSACAAPCAICRQKRIDAFLDAAAAEPPAATVRSRRS